MFEHAPVAWSTVSSPQIVGLVQVNRFVAVCGPSDCGKTAAIQVAAETIRQSASMSQMCHVSTTTVALGAMREEQLLGYQCREKGSVSSLIFGIGLGQGYIGL